MSRAVTRKRTVPDLNPRPFGSKKCYRDVCLYRGDIMVWSGKDMASPLLPEDVTEIDADPVGTLW